MTTLIHPTGEILHILADAGVPHDRLHETARQIAAAYSEANEGISAGASTPRGSDGTRPYA